MKKILASGTLLAMHLTRDDYSPGLNFFSTDADFLQVGSWNYGKGQPLAAHNHNPFVRSAERTQEVIVVVQGALRADIYDEDDTLVESVVVRSGETLVNLAGGHGYEILKDNTLVVEVKNGPYAGPDKDRRRLANNA